MFTEKWFLDLRAVTLKDKNSLLKHSIGVFPDIIDILICLDRWLILDFSTRLDWRLGKISKMWKIFDLKTGRLFGPFYPLDYDVPKSWVEITREGVIWFNWSESSNSGNSGFDLNSGISLGHFGGGSRIEMPPSETVNLVPIAKAGEIIRLSYKLKDSDQPDLLPLGEETLINKALDGRLLVTLDQQLQEVSIWYNA